jgi:hypothetical protein
MRLLSMQPTRLHGGAKYAVVEFSIMTSYLETEGVSEEFLEIGGFEPIPTVFHNGHDDPDRLATAFAVVSPHFHVNLLCQLVEEMFGLNVDVIASVVSGANILTLRSDWGCKAAAHVRECTTALQTVTSLLPRISNNGKCVRTVQKQLCVPIAVISETVVPTVDFRSISRVSSVRVFAAAPPSDATPGLVTIYAVVRDNLDAHATIASAQKHLPLVVIDNCPLAPGYMHGDTVSPSRGEEIAIRRTQHALHNLVSVDNVRNFAACLHPLMWNIQAWSTSDGINTSRSLCIAMPIPPQWPKDPLEWMAVNSRHIADLEIVSRKARQDGTDFVPELNFS